MVAEVALKSQYTCAGRKVKMLYVVQSIAGTATRLPMATSGALPCPRWRSFWADLDSRVPNAIATLMILDLAIRIRFSPEEEEKTSGTMTSRRKKRAPSSGALPVRPVRPDSRAGRRS
jgi:hypothetical protein